METKPTRTAHPPLDVMLDIAPVPAADSANALAVIAVQAGIAFEVQEAPVVEDFDLADYDWVPVRRKARRDGWTVAAQQSFIGVLADTGSGDPLTARSKARSTSRSDAVCTAASQAAAKARPSAERRRR
ncbi:MAG: hypothetical protein EOO77_10255 [Oxalobacteraceae bacterium]|nr:MAG: hypothetical protein EOO77_10255 [Oxalobacteraceae bacterium]